LDDAGANLGGRDLPERGQAYHRSVTLVVLINENVPVKAEVPADCAIRAAGKSRKTKPTGMLLSTAYEAAIWISSFPSPSEPLQSQIVRTLDLP
jgi:hypothetical protein